MKRPLEFDDHLTQMWNDFADIIAANGIVLESFKCGVVTRNDGKGNTLSFNFDTPGGVTDAEASLIFTDYLAEYPHCSIVYNRPVAFENDLKDKSEVDFHVDSVPVKLERIDD